MLTQRYFRLWWIAVLLAAAGVGASMTLPRNATQATMPDRIIEKPVTKPDLFRTIVSYIDSEREDDPLVQVRPGIWAKRSNVEGVLINGTRYYYALLPHASFDPLSRGEVSLDDIQIVQEISEGDFTIVIYTIRPAPGTA